MHATIEAFFLELEGGGRFCVLHSPPPGVGTRGAVVYVHPFAEEMNKSRRMAALQARSLASSGYAVLQMDLFGCGDSAGEFGDATWLMWIDDVRRAVGWLSERTGHAPAMWGLRAGCLLVASAARHVAESSRLLYWQPVASGKRHLQQFLRTQLATQMFSDASDGRIDTAQLYARLERGESIDIAGYALRPDLALVMAAAELEAPPAAAQVVLIEVAGDETAELSPALARTVAAWRAEGRDVATRVVAGLPFWQTQEIAECEPLLTATGDAIRAWA